MRLAALVSGGKDGAYAAHVARMAGHEIACAVTALPASAEDMLWHHPNARHAALHARAMGVPLVEFGPSGGAGLAGALREAAREHGVEGVVHGGLASAHQRDAFGAAASAAGMRAIAPLWGRGGVAYLREVIGAGFRFVVVSVSAGGLGPEWLGAEVTRERAEGIGRLAAEFGFEASFEGGEAETFVVSCPLYSRDVEIRRARASWDGYRGSLEIEDAALRARA
ncbi:MAG: diphthine--ammonia ligase [Thaumarchaeota archaeon]|nr:diphthine--ammonia ligase [Nitrososphaerota archaeon]RNJ72968.1 MAG: diphthine--ammonia ligase [Thaumarchaeota archaeon S14]